MRRNPDIISSKPSIKPQRALLLDHLHHTVQRPRIPPLTPLQPRLDKIKRQTKEARKEARNRTGPQRLTRRTTRRNALQPHLCLGIKRQLSEIQRHGTHNRRRATRPQRRNPLGFRDPSKSVKHTRVVFLLRKRTEAVGLHTDQREVSGISENGAETAGCERGESTLGKGNRTVLGSGLCGEAGHESSKEPHAGGGVDGLAEETGGEAGVEVEEAALRDDLFGDGDGGRTRNGFGGGAFAGKLETDLNVGTGQLCRHVVELAGWGLNVP